MPAQRRLPEGTVLSKHVEEGLTNSEIGDLYGVSGEAVRQALLRMGVRRSDSRPSHAYYLPWRVRSDHMSDVLARRLRSYSKRQQGKALSDSEARLLEEWLRWMDGGNSLGVPLAVHYDRSDDEGFWLEPRQPGDREYVSPPISVAS